MFWVVVSGLLENEANIPQLHGSTYCLWTFWFFQPNKTAFGILQSHPLLSSSIELLCSCYNIPRIDLSITHHVITSCYSSFFGVVHVLLVNNFAGKIMLLKKLAIFELSTSFIVVNDIHLDIILCEISTSMSWHIFTIHSKLTNSFTFSILSLPTTIWPCGTSLELIYIYIHIYNLPWPIFSTSY